MIRIVAAGILVAALSACTSVAPGASTAPSALPGTSAGSSAEATLPPASVSPTDETSATATPTAHASKTPKPSKKPRPTPSPTAPDVEGDIEVSFEQSSIPDPFYVNTDYQIRIYVGALGQQDLPDVHVKLVAKDENVSYKFDTGPIAITDSYYHDVTVNLPANGPSALIVTATMPDGYTDTNKDNNSKSVDINVLPLP